MSALVKFAYEVVLLLAASSAFDSGHCGELGLAAANLALPCLGAIYYCSMLVLQTKNFQLTDFSSPALLMLHCLAFIRICLS